MSVHNYAVNHDGQEFTYTLDMTKKFIIQVNNYHRFLPERIAALNRWIDLLPWLEDDTELSEELCLTASVQEKLLHLNDPLSEDEKSYERVD